MSTILVTGSAKRIAKHISLMLASQGHDIILHYHTSYDQALEVKHSIESLGSTCFLVQQDLLQDNAAENLFTHALEKTPYIHAIINSASIFEADQFEDFSQELWDKHHRIHVDVPLKLTQLLFHHTPKSQTANVINILDQRVKNPTPEFFSYTASKRTMAAMTLQCAVACSPKIRINGISPGATLPSSRQSIDDFQQQARLTPLEISVSPDDIARAVSFLISTPSITGEIITIDAGQNIDWRTHSFLNSNE